MLSKATSISKGRFDESDAVLADGKMAIPSQTLRGQGVAVRSRPDGAGRMPAGYASGADGSEGAPLWARASTASAPTTNPEAMAPSASTRIADGVPLEPNARPVA